MDRYVVKRPPGEAGGGGKRPRQEEPASGQPPCQEIRAEGLNCDYRLLFGRAEADEIFQQLEEEVEYFEGKGRRGARVPSTPLRGGDSRPGPPQASPGVIAAARAELAGGGGVSAGARCLHRLALPSEVANNASDPTGWVLLSLKCVPSGFIHVLIFAKNGDSPGRVTGGCW